MEKKRGGVNVIIIFARLKTITNSNVEINTKNCL